MATDPKSTLKTYIDARREALISRRHSRRSRWQSGAQSDDLSDVSADVPDASAKTNKARLPKEAGLAESLDQAGTTLRATLADTSSWSLTETS